MEDIFRILPGFPFSVRSVPSRGKNACTDVDKPSDIAPWDDEVQGMKLNASQSRVSLSHLCDRDLSDKVDIKLLPELC